EGIRRTTRTISFLTLPTLDQRNGVFKTAAGAPIPIKNPYTGIIYSDGVVPTGQISAFAKKVFGQLPDPTTPGFSNNYQALPRVPPLDNKVDFHVDPFLR